MVGGVYCPLGSWLNDEYAQADSLRPVMVGNNASVKVAADKLPATVFAVKVPVDELSVMVCMQTHQVTDAPWTP